jgi:hypothetical protein
MCILLLLVRVYGLLFYFHLTGCKIEFGVTVGVICWGIIGIVLLLCIFACICFY